MSVFLNGIRDSQVISATVPEKRFVSIALSDDAVTSSFWMFRTYDDRISPNRFSDSRVDVRLRDDEQVSLFRYNRDGSLSTQVLTSSELQEQYNTAKSLYAQSAAQSDYMTDLSCCIKLDSDFAGRPHLSVSGNSFHNKFVDVVKLPCIIDHDVSDITGLGTTLVGSSPEEATFTEGSGASYRLHVRGFNGNNSSNRWLRFYCCPYDPETDTEALKSIPINSETDSGDWRDNIDDFVTLLNDYLGSYRSDINKTFSYGLEAFYMKLLTDDDRVVDCRTYSSDFKEDSLFLMFDKSIPLDSFSNEGLKLRIIQGDACGNLSLTEAFRLNRAALDKINAIESLASDMESRSRVYDESSDSFAPEELSEESLDWSLDVPETDPRYELFRQLKVYQETEHAYRELENARKSDIDVDYTYALQSRDESEAVLGLPASAYRDVAESIINGDVPEAAPIDDSWKNFAAHLGSVEPQLSGLSFLNGVKKSQITNDMGELVVEVALSDNNFWKFAVSPLQLYENHYVSDRMNVAVYSNSDVLLFRDFPYREERTMSGAELKKQYDKARQDYFFAKLGEEEFASSGEPIDWRLQGTSSSGRSSRQNDDTGDFGE